LQKEYKTTVNRGSNESFSRFLVKMEKKLKSEGKKKFACKSKLALDLITDPVFVKKFEKYFDKKKSIENFAKYSNIHLTDKQIEAVFDLLETLSNNRKYRDLRFNSPMDRQILLNTLLLTQNKVAVKLHENGILIPVCRFISMFGIIEPKCLNDTLKTNNSNHYIDGIFKQLRELIIGDLKHKRDALKYIKAYDFSTNGQKELYFRDEQKRFHYISETLLERINQLIVNYKKNVPNEICRTKMICNKDCHKDFSI
jgi:hypothetical protein